MEFYKWIAEKMPYDSVYILWHVIDVSWMFCVI